MDYSSYIGSAGSAFASVIVLATYSMKTMIPPLCLNWVKGIMTLQECI